MAEVTDKDLDQKRDRIASLRDQITTQEAKAASVNSAQSKAVEASQLDAEMSKLEAQLAAAKEQAKVGNIRAGTEDLTATLEAARDAAAEVTPPGVTIDTNAGREDAVAEDAPVNPTVVKQTGGNS